jgi:hypothetical protein
MSADTSREAVERLRRAHQRRADDSPPHRETHRLAMETDAMLRDLIAERDAARKLLAKAAADIEATVTAEYAGMEGYPDQMRRKDRDMDLVRRIRAHLAGEAADV